MKSRRFVETIRRLFSRFLPDSWFPGDPLEKAVLEYAALLPADGMSWAWLRGLSEVQFPGTAKKGSDWDSAKRRLLGSGSLADGDTPETFRIDPALAAKVRAAMTPANATAAVEELRTFVSGRLDAANKLRRRAKNRILTGDENKAPDAWTIPNTAVAMARSRPDDPVIVFPHSESGFSIRSNLAASLEERCLKAFIEQQFASDSIPAVEWALGTWELEWNSLNAARDRMKALRSFVPDAAEGAILYASFLLNFAAMNYDKYGGRAGWAAANEACAVLTEAKAAQPEHPELAKQLERAEKAAWTYDD